MKNIILMKKWFATYLLLAVSTLSWAYDFEVNGIYYNITGSNNVAVTYNGNNSYSGSYSGTVVIPSSVEYNNHNYTVTSIDEWAFNSRYYLTSITIPNSVTSIGSEAFSDCSRLTSVTIGKSVTSIGSHTFWYCSGLTSVICLAENVPTTGSSAFYNVPQSTATLYVPAGSVDAYKAAAQWKEFGTVKSVILSGTCGNGVNFVLVDDYTLTISGTGGMFDYTANTLPWKDYTTEIRNVQIEDGVRSIGDYAFQGCSGLKSVTIGSGVTSIGNYAFQGCSGLKSVTIGSGVKSIGNSAFYDCSGLTSVSIPNSVTSIGNYAFQGCSGLTSITIPESVTSIGNYTFYNCSGLTSINIPNSVTSIDEWAFYNCYGLTSVTIGGGVTSIGGNAFSGCSSLTSITIPYSVTSIGQNAFYNCSHLTDVTIGMNVTSIGKDAFRNCSRLTKAKFASIESLCNIAFPDNVYGNPLSVAHHLYVGGQEVKDLVIPNSVTNIRFGTFYGCSGLTSVTIPNSVTSIGKSAFSGCSSLTSIVIPNSVMNIGDYAFYHCSDLTSATIGNSVTIIGGFAFQYCSSLTSIDIPNSVTKIGDSAFSDCSGLNSVTVGGSVTNIGNYAFYNCSGLTSVTCLAEKVPSMGGSVFSGVPQSSATLNVPAVSVYAYKATEQWKEFGKIDDHVYIETDFTSLFPTDYLGWNGATGYTSTTFAPMVTTNDGRTVQVCEKYNGSVAAEGVVFSRVLTGLTNGTYRIELYGAAASTKGRDAGIDSDMTQADEGDETAVYLYATTTSGTVKQYIPVHWATSFSEVATAVLNNVVVTDGTVEIGMYSDKKFTNWEVIQIKGVTALVDAEEMHANTLTRAQSALDDEAYVNVTGEERTALSQAIADNTTVGVRTAEAYQAAITALENATKAFTEAKVSYDIWANVAKRSYPYASAEKKSAAESAASVLPTSASDALSKAESLKPLFRRYAESSAMLEGVEGAEDVTATYIRNPKAEEAIDANVWQTVLGEGSGGSVGILGNEPWTDSSGSTSHKYFDGGNWRASAWDVTFKQDITLPAGRYQLTAVGRSSQDVALTLIGGEATAEMAHINATGGLFNNGWEQTSLEFELTEETTVSIGARGATNVIHNWMSFSDFRLVRFPGCILSGKCGANVDFVLTSDYTLTISGIGDMFDYIANTLPWKNYTAEIKNVVVEDGVTNIGQAAFVNCSELSFVTIPESVTRFGAYAFSRCSSLTSITIPDGVTSIGNYTFSGCSGLTSIDIPNSVTSIGEGAFYGCSGLTSIVIPNSVTSIGEGAFYGCSGLTSINIPNSVTSIGSEAFLGCSGLTSVTIGNSVTSIGDCTFYECSGLTSINVPNSVTSIGSEAFLGCSSLTSITIPESVTSIGDWAFSGCSGLTSITCLAENVPTTDSDVFYNVPQSAATLYVPAASVNAYKAADEWKNFGTIRGFVLSGKCGNDVDFVLTDDYTLTISGTGDMFDYNANTLPWKNYTAEIKNVVVEDGVTRIGDSAFQRCTGLTSISIPESVTRIGNYAFYGCDGLTSVTIPNSVTSIGDYAFYWCKSLTSVTIPNSVMSIGEDAFGGCSGLTSITVVSGNTKYDSRNDCNAIIETSSNTLVSGCKNTIIPNTVTSIGQSAFHNCSDLTSIIIPNSVTSIGSSAFSGCSGLTSITIPESVTSIGDMTFRGCSGLTKAEFSSIENLCKLSFGSGASNPLCYAKHLYIGGQEVKDVIIPNTVTNIGRSAFYGCSGLTSVTIPNSVTSIGNSAFRDCSGLTSITCLAENVPATSSGVFSGVPQSTATLYVPAGSVDAYKAADEWKNFGTIKAYDLPDATSVALNKTETTLAVGAKEQLTATVLPEEAEQAVTWTSSDPTVATVDENGLVTAVAAGTATITATTTDGTRLTASCEVKVAIPGDVNGDGNVNGADIVAVINYVLADDIAGDVNGDGNVNGADIVAVINYVLNDSGNNARQTLAQSRAAAAEEPAEILSGTKTEEGISLSLTGGEDCTAFQFMLSLPEGASLTAVTGSEERLGDHELLFRRQQDGRYLVLGFAMDNRCIGESSGELLSLQLTGNANGRAIVSEALIFTPQAETRYMNALEIDLPTAVSGVRVKGAAKEGEIYDLGGRKLNKKPSSGYYIQGGKKYFVK